jgi:hypothetical protein
VGGVYWNRASTYAIHITMRDGVGLARPRRGREFTHPPYLAARYGNGIRKWKIIPANQHRSARVGRVRLQFQ